MSAIRLAVLSFSSTVVSTSSRSRSISISSAMGSLPVTLLCCCSMLLRASLPAKPTVTEALSPVVSVTMVRVRLNSSFCVSGVSTNPDAGDNTVAFCERKHPGCSAVVLKISTSMNCDVGGSETRSTCGV